MITETSRRLQSKRDHPQLYVLLFNRFTNRLIWPKKKLLTLLNYWEFQALSQ